MTSTVQARVSGRATGAAGVAGLVSDAFTSEECGHANTKLARRPRETQTRVQRRHVVLVGQVRAPQGRDDLVMPPGELRVQDVARFDLVAARLVLEQRGPLVGDVAVIDARGELVVAALPEHVLHADIEGEVGCVGLVVTLEVEARGTGGTGLR